MWRRFFPGGEWRRLGLLARGVGTAVTLWCGTWGAVAQAAPSGPADLLASLRPEHPRLIVTATEWQNLRTRRFQNPELDAILQRVEAEARALLPAPPVTYKKQGRRLLSVSREALGRLVTLGFAYRLTDDKIFLARAQQEMEAVIAFADWNPSHFLDVAEMAAGLALSYDWLFADLPEALRVAIRRALVEKGLQPALDPTAKWNGWQRGQNNWNQVCFGGLTLSALAIAEAAPGLAREFLALARRHNPAGLAPYAPDGIYPEGPAYWNYGTSYQVLMISALQTALGTDWGLSAAPGFLASAAALVMQTGPTGRPYNFFDASDSVAFYPALFWFAQSQHQPGLVHFQNQWLRQRLAEANSRLAQDRLFPLVAVWGQDLADPVPMPALPLAWHGDGPNPIGVFRSSWTDSNALFLAFKGGSAQLPHAHMDAGSFVLEADGVRWAVDLGAQNYFSIESKGWDLWGRGQQSDRWRVYRLNNFSHNTLTLDGQLHRVNGAAHITQFTSNSATLNLSAVFAGQAGRVTRVFTVEDDRGVRIRDEIAGARAGLPVRWQMVTRAQVRLQGAQAELRQNGRGLRATIQSPAQARFEVADARPPDDGVNQENPHTRILLVNVPTSRSGELTLVIRLEPGLRP